MKTETTINAQVNPTLLARDLAQNVEFWLSWIRAFGNGPTTAAGALLLDRCQLPEDSTHDGSKLLDAALKSLERLGIPVENASERLCVECCGECCGVHLWRLVRVEARSVAPSPQHDEGLHQALTNFVLDFACVFGYDDRKSTRRHVCESKTCIENYGTILEPGVADESNNWPKLGALLVSYRKLMEAMIGQGLLGDSADCSGRSSPS